MPMMKEEMDATERIHQEENFLIRLFNALEIQGVRYAVMRNYETLSYTADDSGLNILASPSDEVRLKSIIFQAIEQAGGVLIGCMETVGFFKIHALGRFTSQPHGWWGLCIDVNLDFFFKGIRLVNFNNFELNKHNGITVLSRDLSAVLGVLEEVLHNNHTPYRYLEEARKVAIYHWAQAQAQLYSMGVKALILFQQILVADSKSVDIRAKSRQLCNELMIHAFLQQPLVCLKHRFLFEWSKIHRYLNPPGIVIAVLGVDGAGKSTIINAVRPVLETATHNALFIQHLRPGLLPPLARLKGKVEEPSSPVVHPHGSAPSSALGSLLRLCWLTIDYVLGYWLRIRLKIAKQPAVVLYDRYAYDMALDPRRFRIGLPSRIAWWFTRLAPKPDLILCLYAKPESIVTRKQELPLEETRRQIEALRAFAQHEPRSVLISTDGSVEEVRDEVLETLHKFFARRAKNGCKHD